MKRVKLGLVFLSLSILIIGILYFVSAAAQTISISPGTGESGVSQLYNITINNLETIDVNITQVSMTIPSTLNVSSTGTSTGVTATNSSASIFVFTGTPLIVNGTTQYFWFNSATNQTGTYNVNITTLDNNSVANSTNVTITISDTTIPIVSFVSPTPSSGSTLNGTYIQANTTASDSGSGLKNITIYLYNSTSLVGSHTGTSSPYLYNFTSLSDGVYYINATAYDNSNNKASASTRTITISTTPACTPSWTCSWSECINNTQTKTNCVDSNNCGATAPTGNQTCCIPNLSCGNWTPVTCSSGTNQTKICTDLNNCTAPTTTTRKCVLTSASTANASSNSVFSSSSLFFIILGVIVLSVIGVFIVLMRMKKKSASSNSGSDSEYRTYSPRGPPPSSFPPPGYSNPPQSYQNQPQGY